MSSLTCRICLRTNVATQDLPNQLKTFHDELCDYETVQHKRLKFCASCTHLMKKFYKFKGQCLRANGLLKLWIKHQNKDISEYHKELPPPSLQITDNSTSFLFECQHDENGLHNTNVTEDRNRNLVLKMYRAPHAPDDIMHPESFRISLKSNPSIRDRPKPDLNPTVRLSDILRSELGKPCDPGFKTNIGKGDLRPKLENGMLTIDPNLLSMPSRPSFRPNLGLRPSFRPTLSLRPAIRPDASLKPVLRPTTSLRPVLRVPSLGLPIPLVPSGHKQPKQIDLTYDPDFDVSYETDPLSPVKTENTIGIEDAMDIGKEESIAEIKRQEVYIDNNIIDIDDAVASVAETEEKELDDSEWTIDKEEDNDSMDNTIDKKGELYDSDNTIDKKRELYDSDSMDNTIDKKGELYDSGSMDNTIDKKEELINDNDADSDIDSDEYTYEYLEQDSHLLDFTIKPKQKEPSEATSLEKKQVIKTTEKEQIKIIDIEVLSNKNNLRPVENETNIALKENKGKRITRKCVRKTKYKPIDELAAFKAVPSFKEKVFGLLDASPFVLDDETVLTRELLSVIYDKFTMLEVKRLAMIVLEEDFRAKLMAYLSNLYRKYNPEYETIFHVEQLHTEEMKHEDFKRRALYPDYINADYKCELCYRTYTRQGFLDYHKKVHHNPAGPVICAICSYSLRSRSGLIQHRVRTHSAAYTCKLCPLRTNLVEVMRNHYNSHKGTLYECRLCHKVFYNANTLSNHKRRAHATHVCVTCAQQYTTERGLRTHRETLHKDEAPPDPARAVSCVTCDVTFDTRQSYDRHCLIAHEPIPEKNIRKIRVMPPPLATTTQAINVNKKRIKTEAYRTCEICHEKVYVEKFRGLLYRHFKDKHPGVPYHVTGKKTKDYLCDECGKSFLCQATLLDHKNYHLGLRPHVCKQCSARFHTKSGLWVHQGCHKQRRYRCDECGKLFKNGTHLTTHKKIHIGDRCFKCNICDKDFLYKCSLKEHIQGVHYNVRRVKKLKKPAQETQEHTSNTAAAQKKLSNKDVKCLPKLGRT